MTNTEGPMGPLIVDVAGLELTGEDRELLAHPLVGGTILFTRNFESREQVTRLVADMRSAADKPLLVTVDHEGGRVQRFRDSGFTRLPPVATLADIAVDDSAAARRTAQELAWLMAFELRAADIDLSWAPVLDRHTGASDIIGNRAFGADQQTIKLLASAYITGMAELGMGATGKHFPGHGTVVGDSHKLLPVDDRPMSELQKDIDCFVDLLPRLQGIMMAHVVYPQVDELPASFSPHWIQHELRQTLGFQGAVVCDDLSMEGAVVIGDYPVRAQAALDAGCDWLPVCNNREGVTAILDKGVSDSAESAVRRELLMPREPRPIATFASLPRWKAATQVARLAHV